MSEAEQGGRLPLKPIGVTTYAWEQVREQAHLAFLAGWERHGQFLANNGLVGIGKSPEEATEQAVAWVATWLPSDEVRRQDYRPGLERIGVLERVLERRLDHLERTTAESLAARAMAHEVDAMGAELDRRVAELESRVLAASQALGGGA